MKIQHIAYNATNHYNALAKVDGSLFTEFLVSLIMFKFSLKQNCPLCVHILNSYIIIKITTSFKKHSN